MKKISSLSIFFPFYNDAGTVLSSIKKAYEIGHQITDKLEVIAIHGGNSKDDTYEKILEAKKIYPDLKIVDKKDNKEGYAVIKHGFYASTMEWVFYTDGDAQYNLEDLKLLVKEQEKTGSDVVNGYKLNRGDGFIRFFLGDMYAKFSRFVFELPIRDTDCDFRLIRNSLLKKIEFVSTDSSILGELIKKLEIEGATFSELGVRHYERSYGKSNYSPLDLVYEKLTGDIKLYLKLKNKEHLIPKLRIIKFSMVGFSSVSIQIIIFNLLIIFTQIPAHFAVILADQFAIINSFILNNKFTFKDKKLVFSKKIIFPFFKFYLIVSITTLVQSLIVWIGTRFFSDNFIYSNLFFVIGLIIAFFINYKFQKKLVWNF